MPATQVHREMMQNVPEDEQRQIGLGLADSPPDIQPALSYVSVLVCGPHLGQHKLGGIPLKCGSHLGQQTHMGVRLK